MIEVLEKEAKTKEDLLSSINEEDYSYYIEEIPSKLFKGKKYILKYASKDDIKSYITNFIKNFSESIDNNINTEIRYNNDCYNVMLISENNALIIGKDGRILNSIQLLLRQSLNNQLGFNVKLCVDAANYKANKEKKLESEIKRIAKEVLSTKIEAKLDPMNSYDRRIVHNIVGNYSELSSESFGEEPTRYIVISYKED